MIFYCTSQKIIQGSTNRRALGLVNFVPALAYLFCRNLPASLTQPGGRLLVELRTSQKKIYCVKTGRSHGFLRIFIRRNCSAAKSPICRCIIHEERCAKFGEPFRLISSWICFTMHLGCTGWSMKLILHVMLMLQWLVTWLGHPVV